MNSYMLRSSCSSVVVAMVAFLGCKPETDTTKPSPSAAVSSSASPVASLTAPTAQPSPSSSSSPSSSGTAEPKVFHYDLVIAGPETIKVSLDASDAATGSVSFGKNVVLGSGNRSDVGSTIKGKVTMQGDIPVLDLDATIGSVDAAINKVQKASLKGSAPTPLGQSTVVIDTTQDGKAYKITATPAAATAAAIGTPSPGGNFVVDVGVTYLTGSAPAKKTSLSFNMAAETPATAKQGESVPLVVADGGVAIPRQDTGTRVKAVAHPHTNGLALDFDLELSGTETATLGMSIRRITVRGPVLAAFDKPTTAFSADDNGHRYEVTVTPRRAKQ
jgi:hypothetical protein